MDERHMHGITGIVESVEIIARPDLRRKNFDKTWSLTFWIPWHRGRSSLS
jgi:hypothetical protein